MFVLVMNPMQGRAEGRTEVARAETREALIAFHERLRVEPYTDDNRWHKTFRRGSPLEWFNPLTPSELEEGYSSFGHGIFDVGTEEDHAQRARQRFRDSILRLADVDSLGFREDGVPF